MSMSKDEINVGLFDRVKELERERDALRAEVERLKADKALLEKVIEVAGHKMLGAAIKETMGDAQ